MHPTKKQRKNFIKIRNYLMQNYPNKSLYFLALYIRISELSLKYGFCTASNEYLATEVGISTRQVSRTISKLEEEGFIRCDSVKNNNKTKRKIYICQDYLEKRGITDNSEEDELDNIVEDDLDNIVNDLPDVKPPDGLFGRKTKKKKTKSKEEKSNERALKKTFNESVVNVYPADKRGSVSKAFTVFKNLKFDDQQEVLSNIKRYVDMIDIPYHKSLINCLNDGDYKDEYLDAREKSNRKRTSKTESSTAHNFNKNNSLDDYYKIN